MDKVAHMVGEKVGEAVEGAFKQVLGVKDKNKDSDKKKGGGLSLFGGNKKKEQEKQDEGKGGFISNLFDKGGNDKGVKKSTGFSGLFAEPEEGDGARESDGGVCEYNPTEGNPGQGEATGGGLYDDLLDVATEISTEQ